MKTGRVAGLGACSEDDHDQLLSADEEERKGGGNFGTETNTPSDTRIPHSGTGRQKRFLKFTVLHFILTSL